MIYKIIPTVIAKSEFELDSIVERLHPHFDSMHLDIMDGIFVNNKSNWFDDIVLYPGRNYEVHLMVDDPERWVHLSFNNFEKIIVNYERVKDPFKLIESVKKKNQKIGFSLNPGTSILEIISLMGKLDTILLLTVEPGSYGAKFVPEVVEKVRLLRTIYGGDIEVDGGMNPETIRLCKENGANLFAVGSYIQRNNDLVKAKAELEAALL